MPQDEVKFNIWLTSPRCLRVIEEGGAPNYVVGDDNVDMATQGWVKVAEMSVTLNRPAMESLRLAFITNLEVERSRVYAEAERDATRITKTINELLAIGFTATEVPHEDDIPF